MGYRVNNRCDTEGIPMYLVNEFLKEVSIPLLVELGTAGGASIKEAAKYFEQCYTIELNEDRPDYDVTLKNVEWLTGSTVGVLPSVIEEFIKYKQENGITEDYRYCLFWVDSHFDGDKPEYSPYKDCYLLEELDIISKYSADAIIIIDDARLFMGYPPHPNEPKEWPTIAQIFDKFKTNYPYNFTTIVDDYIISFPDRIEWVFQKEWMKKFSTRYPSDADKLKVEARNVFNAIKNYVQ